MSERDQDVWTVAAINMNRRSLLRYVLAAAGSTAVAEDLVQDTFRVAYENRGNFTAGTDLGAWLRGIARNRIRQYFDERKKQPILCGEALDALETAAAENEPWQTDDSWHERRLRAMERCIEKITMKTRRIVEARYLHRQSAAYVAHRFRMTVTAVNVAVFRARQVLVECVRKEMAE